MSNDKTLNYFDQIPTDRDRHGDLKKSNPLRARNEAYNTYLQAVTALVESVREDFRVYNANGNHAEWVEAHKRRIARMNTACNEFRKQISLFALRAEPLGEHNESPVTGTPHPDKLERWPGETPEEHEHRLFQDFGIRVPATKPDPGAIIFPPDPTVELLTDIRELLGQLVSNQVKPAVTIGEINTYSPDAAVREYKRAVVTDNVRAADTPTTKPASADTSPGVVYEKARLAEAVNNRNKTYDALLQLCDEPTPLTTDDISRFANLGRDLADRSCEVKHAASRLATMRLGEAHQNDIGGPGKFSNPTAKQQ